MNKIIKTTLILFVGLLLAWILPSAYHFGTTKKNKHPFVLYSCLLNDFIIQSKSDSKTVFEDEKGNAYTREEVDSLAPTMYYRQLITDNRMPDTILGVAVTPQLLSKTSFFFINFPRYVNANNIKLYPLLESRPKRVDLSMPDDVCRFTDKKICFIDMKTNSENIKKSEIFQHVFDDKGVQFPIKTIAGNPTLKKEYDEGYFFIDGKNRLFHFKQVAGTPYLKKVDIEKDVIIEHIFVTEFTNRSSFAFITDKNNKFYVLTAPDYKLIKTGIPSFDPTKDNIFIIGDMFNWNVKIANKKSVTNYALCADNFSLIDSLPSPVKISSADKTAKYLFPFELQFTSSLDNYFSPHLINFSWSALFFNILLAILYLVMFRKDKKIALIAPAICTLLFGLFAFLPSWIFRQY